MDIKRDEKKYEKFLAQQQFLFGALHLCTCGRVCVRWAGQAEGGN